MSKKEEKQWHYVDPKRDCPHIHKVKKSVLPSNIVVQKCMECGCGENWCCLTCGEIFCSRYQKGHAAEHYKKTKHTIAISFSDLSFWCYECNDYIEHFRLRPSFTHFYKDKFGEDEEDEEKMELFDKEEEVKENCKKLAGMIKKANYIVVYTGAGISTAASIPDYRGPQGCWTMRDKGMKAFMPIRLTEAKPTYAHNAIAKLAEMGKVKFVVSTNVDSLHLKSGLSLSKLAELHGNIYKEICVKCKKVHYRKEETSETKKELTSKITVGDHCELKGHFHGRYCEDCGGRCIDSIIHFNENLPTKELNNAYTHSDKSDLSIVIGTSMRVQPACSLPLRGRKNKGFNLVLMNLQKTPYDGQMDLIFRAKSELVWRAVMGELGIKVKEPEKIVMPEFEDEDEVEEGGKKKKEEEK